ncbi:double-stranded RNA-binding protein 3 [Phtheirospermum japonicum]|uniref:Double-stranded RNA-binding protein 3 n=1 Tax=Phtheirospermum japonicum TaxID=374723 RepID=A0A830D1J1_9LAMI|nr:double-stranded RNA-binding protein 3 [Phtheirospermum japonicum]
MYKNQLQELAQRSCFNLPSYACVREGPDHAPRFKASVNFNGEIFEGPTYSTTLRQAEHAAAEVALNSLSARGPSKSLTARVLDETGVYKNLLQETAHRAGLKLPLYTTVRSGPGHVPVFTSTVELAGLSFTGEPAKTKKQAEKNAAITAWSALKKMPNFGPLSQTSKEIEQRRDESRVIRRRPDHQYHHSRGKLQRPGPARVGQWKLPDPIPDPGLPKQNNFLCLLPPPPGRAMSKILPPNLPNNYQSKTSLSELNERQIRDNNNNNDDDDDHDWISKLSEAIIINKQSSHFNGGKAVYTPTIKGPSTCSQIGRSGFTGVYHQYPQRIAPAVQIRSVVPVCAAPPVQVRPSPSSNPTVVKETGSTSSSSTAELASTLSKMKL